MNDYDDWASNVDFSEWVEKHQPKIKKDGVPTAENGYDDEQIGDVDYGFTVEY